MRFTHVTVDNFRSIHHADLPLSPFVCAVGHNNAGKSSMLMALSLFASGSKLSRSDFYDPNQDVVISVTIGDVTEAVIDRLAAEHQDRIKELVEDCSITLIRRYNTTGSGGLRCHRKVPLDDRFLKENIATLMKGKSGTELREAVSTVFPELLDGIAKEKPKSQKDFKVLIDELCADLPASDFTTREEPLPTGFDNSVASLFPEVIYIPAVKDATDEVKTKEASSFGRILKILLDLIDGTEQIQAVEKSFGTLHGLLNKTIDDDGNVVDERITEVREIEARVAGFIREQFRDVKLDIEIPPPDMKTIFTSAKIFLDDGVRGEIETKGDGLKRAMTFALLRTFVDLRNRHKQAKHGDASAAVGRYLFLFEEPELYLHPGAQRILYDALVEISEEHQVCVCTHSPYFFSATGSGTFLRLKKVPHAGAAPESPPITDTMPVNLVADFSKRDAFQIICYENNSAAFFCDRVVLVEGDCDVIFLKHIARVLDSRWDFDRRNIAMIRIGGKGNFARYRAFFEGFNVDVRIIADLDALVDQFEKLGAPPEIHSFRSDLLKAVDGLIEKRSSDHTLARKDIERITGTRTFRDRYAECKRIAAELAAGNVVTPQDLTHFGALFAPEHDYHRQYAIGNSEELARQKGTLLSRLRSHGINVLSRGCIEDYYPPDCEGPDKPSRALAACSRVRTAKDALACCPQLEDGDNGIHPEFKLVFENIFDA